MFMADSEKKTIISLFAHPDDELGSIGTLVNHAERGDNVIMGWTTYGELTTMFPDFSPEEVKRERMRHANEIVKIVGAQKAVILDLGDSNVQQTREQRIAVAKFYVQERPDVVITWGVSNVHPDHRNTSFLALDAIKFARINRIVETDKPHRENVKLLMYYEEGSPFQVKYVDISEEVMEKVKAAAQFYADIYKWKNTPDWTITRRRSRGYEANTKYAEKFNVRFEFDKPSPYVI